MYYYLLNIMFSTSLALVLPGRDFLLSKEISIPSAQLPGRDTLDLGSPIGPGRGNNQVDRDLEPFTGNKTQFFLVERDDIVYETSAPPGTRWEPMDGAQWDDWTQDVVVKAWNLAMQMAKEAVSSLKTILPGSPNYQLFESQVVVAEGVCKAMKRDQTRMTPEYLLCYRTFIAAHHLAYGQLFGADPENVELILKNFERIVEQTENLDATSEGVPSADNLIRDNTLVYLTHGPTLTNLGGKNLCLGEKSGDGPTQAVTVTAAGTQEFGGKNIIPDHAYLIHFCPTFFHLPRMEVTLATLRDDPSKKNELCNLNALDSTARAVLHEMTHLPWVLNTNYPIKPFPERYGFHYATQFAAETDERSIAQTLTTKISSRNADSYAWMAVYNYFNSVDLCQGVKYSGPNAAPESCNTDVWPSGRNTFNQYTPKLVKLQWKSYKRRE